MSDVLPFLDNFIANIKQTAGVPEDLQSKTTVWEALVNDFKFTLKTNDTEARQALAASFYGEALKKGINPNDVWNDLPKELQDAITYSPEELRANQNLVLAASGISIAAMLAGGVAALLGAPIAIPLAALGMGIAMIANVFTDVFHWGPQMADKNAADIKNILDGAETVGITEFGQFTSEDIRGLSIAYQNATIPGLKDPFSGTLYNIDVGGVGQALQALIGRLNAEGNVPSKKEVIALLRGWTLGSTDRSRGAAPVVVEKPKHYKAYYQFTPESRTVPEKGTKMFIGTVFSGRIAPIGSFTRHLDDRITSEADLLNDAKINLALWLSTFPGKLTFEIQLKNNPFDEQNVRHPGMWAVLSLYVNSRFGKRMFIDEVILGPIDPATYFPDNQRMLSVAQDLPEFADFENIKIPTSEVPAGSTPEVPSETSPEEVPQTPSTPEVPYVPPTPPPPPPEVPESVEITGSQLANDYNLFKEAYVLIYGAFGSYKEMTGETGFRAYWENRRPYNIWLDGLAQEYNDKKKTQMGEAATISFEGGFEGYAITEKQMSVNVDVLLVRAGPSTGYALAGSERLYLGDNFKAIGYVLGQEVSGENRWWVSEFGNYVWVGGTQEKP